MGGGLRGNDFEGLDHKAFASHVEMGYTFASCPWKPRTALAYRFASGDEDRADGDHRTFDNLYPTKHIHYGQTDLFSWRNMHNMELDVSVSQMENITANVEYHAFFPG